MTRSPKRSAALAATCAAALGLGLTLAASAPAASAPTARAAAAAPGPRYNAEQVHHFLEGFYGNHGPRVWERKHLVTNALKRKAARTHNYDLLLCAQNTPKDIAIGKVTTAQSAGMGWATVTNSWGGGRKTAFTAYVGLDSRKQIKLADIDCTP
ncbi:hypothetical protein [Streptomyces sp. H27-D2]|uniref:hypothetical protein n=1 Tax=Streptomyces sp. H27-D2 TaxID=3046304 RepID=UPI002DB75963|nr:hypothetical protein [Streptomyces sp. H27-D2]MEC4019775.1 hypothetical protein [Streptomyces sp. H27-D2]